MGRRRHAPFAWVTLDERHNDPAVLVHSVAAALDEIEPLGESVFAPLLVPSPSLWNALIPRLSEALRERQLSFVLVLDDLHRVANPDALQLLAAIAESVPEGSRIAIASRDEPAIALGRLRAQRMLVEVREGDLVMTQAEAASLLAQAGLKLDREAIELLIARTEGWPAGLYLAALALADEEDVTAAVERFYGDDRFVADYLRDEFLSALTAAEHDFLIRTSVLDRLSGPLCDAVLEREGSAETLRHLARSNLLLVPLDHRDREYRYHALLREMLESELRALGARHEVDGTLGRAAGTPSMATSIVPCPHAIATGNRELAGDLIWANTASYLSTGRSATLRRWLDLFSEAEIESSPALSLARAGNHLHHGEGGQVEHWTAAATEALKVVPAPDSAELALGVKLVRASGAAREGVVRMGDDVADVYELLPDDSPWRSLCRFLEGTALHLSGDRERARPLLEEGYRRGATAAPTVETLSRAQLGLLALDEDDSAAAAALLDRASEQLEHFGLRETPTQGLVCAVAALVRAGGGRVEDANRDATVAAELVAALRDFSPWYEAETRMVIARALLLLDDVAGARAQLAEAGRYLRQTRDAIVLLEWIEAAWNDADAANAVTGRWPLSPAELRLLHFLPTHRSFPEIAEAALRLDQYGQDAGSVDLPQVRRELASGSGRMRAGGGTSDRSIAPIEEDVMPAKRSGAVASSASVSCSEDAPDNELPEIADEADRGDAPDRRGARPRRDPGAQPGDLRDHLDGARGAADHRREPAPQLHRPRRVPADGRDRAALHPHARRPLPRAGRDHRRPHPGLLRGDHARRAVAEVEVAPAPGGGGQGHDEAPTSSSAATSTSSGRSSAATSTSSRGSSRCSPTSTRSAPRTSSPTSTRTRSASPPSSAPRSPATPTTSAGSTTTSSGSRTTRASTSRCTSTGPAAASSGRSSTRTSSGTSGSSRCARSTSPGTSSASSTRGSAG